MIHIGDKVKIINEKEEGIVKKILDAKNFLVQVGDFEYQYIVDNLIKIDEEIPNLSDYKINPIILQTIREEKEFASAGKKKVKLKKGNKFPHITEIDLHSNEILSDTSRMTAGQILNYQLNHFISELDNAIARKEKKIIFIHGKGEGVLREEIRRILLSHELVFYDAPFRFYGGGATLVEL